MMGSVPATGPFRGFTPFDEAAAETFYGRREETTRLTELVLTDANRVSALTGELGVGKTSLLRAGLIPALQKRGVVAIYLGAYDDIDAEVLQATSRAGVDPPQPNQEVADYLARIARESRAGTVLILDHLEEILGDELGIAADLGTLLARALETGGNRLRLVLSVTEAWFPRLDLLFRTAGVTPQPGAWMTLGPLTETQVTEIFEQTALQSGVFFEGGLSAAVAADMVRGRARPLELQLVGAALLNLRLTSLRKYQRSGGAEVLPLLYLDQVCAQAGGALARRVLVDVAESKEIGIERLENRQRRPRPQLVEILNAFKKRSLIRSRPSRRGDFYALVHPALRGPIEDFAIADRGRATATRRGMRRRLNAGERLRVRDLVAVRRHLGAALTDDEQAAVSRGVRRLAVQVGVAFALLIGLGVFLLTDLRRSYTLGFDPPGGGGAARVVVRLGRSSLSFFNFLPNRPRFGAVLADTGFSPAGLVAEEAEKIAAGKASGTLDAAADRKGARSDKPNAPPVPGWLREVLSGLRPVPRGVAKALLGDPDGVTSLKHAFSDPRARRETLEALAVIGSGRAGEDEILSAALTDSAPEIRRRGVEVAAAIDRRQGGGAHGATLRTALADKSLDVRAAVLREAASLPPAEAGGILTVALRDPDPAFRKNAEDATLALAERAPGAAAEAVQQVLQSPDGGVRRAGLALLETIAARAPAACAGALSRVVANEQAPEEARVAALLVLRRAGVPSEDLHALLEKAVRPEASPRLRAAALPLYARFVSAEQAEEIARTEMKGAAPARAAGAAVWGTVAISRPDLALKPLKGLLYDPSTDIRLEAARSFAYLKRDGINLAEKALRDSSVEVERAALDSLMALTAVNVNLVADILGRAGKTVRPVVRRNLIEALGRLGETRPNAVLPSLAHAMKDSDAGVRTAAANAFCGISKKNAAAASPYLRIAARDDRHEVRTAAAACLGDLGDADPKGAARIAIELGDAGEASVRIAAAESMGRLGGKAVDLAIPALTKLAGDPDRNVRIAAVRALAGVTAAASAPGPGNAPGGASFAGSRRGGEVERTLNAALLQGDAGERRLVVEAAAKAGLVTVLRQATADGDESVRLAAVRAAGALSPPALDVVRGAVDDRANAVRAEATQILSGASGAGAREVLPIFESMLRGGDRSAREAAMIGIGQLSGAGEAGARLLGEALGQRSEALRTGAARALGQLAEREPDVAAVYLERAVRDPSYDVRNAAIPGLARAWAGKQTADELRRTLLETEADSPHRFVALEALVVKAQTGTDGGAAGKALGEVAASGPPLARLAAQLGRSFVSAPLGDLHAFLERLLGS
ncbi:MAG TPA: HEAT repeat domain-containing protein [Polyangia bacterium]|jgi:HEAT repeat protein|nr:HEAT repeat domain-containing protein [Polyangia bacterium]